MQSAHEQVAQESAHEAHEQVLWLHVAQAQDASVHSAQMPSHDPQEQTAHSS